MTNSDVSPLLMNMRTLMQLKCLSMEGSLSECMSGWVDSWIRRGAMHIMSVHIVVLHV
jgi:hypothetical protein